MSDSSEQPGTVRERALTIGLSPERLEEHVAERRLRVDGELVTDLDTLTTPGSRITAWPTAEG